jgi:hypothetical protein
MDGARMRVARGVRPYVSGRGESGAESERDWKETEGMRV